MSLSKEQIAELAKPFSVQWGYLGIDDLMTISNGDRHVDARLNESDLSLSPVDFNSRVITPMKAVLA